ncbi:hypothetical protein PYW07_012559 [Mythimna separata]|uniref:Uncharacterized protein n=1 Tax=Mythimna separata TaxID=271217 RepID=A0AAD7Y8L3_MYTSE|nr:hypothetical protein PYW07_012559 [Mythimna separata]
MQHKLSMCRICLVENVRMFVIANKSLQEIYEKLSNTPLVTEDSRPMLACYLCYAKLKQSYRLQRRCLEAERWFAQILSEDCEKKPQVHQDHFQFTGYVISPIECVNIFDECPTKNDAIKEELQDVAVEQNSENRIATEHEFQNLENIKIKYYHSESEDTAAQHSESDSEEVPLLELKTEIKEEPEVIESSFTGTTDVPLLQPDFEVYVPLIEFKTELVEEDQEVSEKKLKIQTTKNVPVMELQKQDERRAKPEDTNKTQQKNTEQPNTKIIRNIHNQTSQPTELIESSTASSSSFLNYLNKPIRINNGEKQYECNICLRSFRDNNDLVKHAGIHAGEKPFKCKLCQKKFTAKGALTKHIRIHNGENPYKRKIKDVDSPPKRVSEKSFECDMCQRVFREKGALRKHVLLHSGEKPFKCDVCQRSFAVASNLKRHIEKHSGNKDKYKCEICQRGFSEKSSLKRHTSIHTGEKPYKCETCQRSFSAMGPLRKHIRRHTGEKPFKCDICERNFSDASNLRRHIRIHMSAQLVLSQ